MLKEQAADYLEALAHEREGYEARAAAVKVGHADPLTDEQLAARIKQVDAEHKRVSELVPARGKAKPRRR